MAGHSKQYDILQSYIPLHVLFIIIDIFSLFNVFRYHKHYFVLNLKHSIKINMGSKNYCNWYDQL